MPIDFPPVFYTATMVKILREQGSTQYATDLAELILREQPDNQEVRRLLDELKEDARRAFERFKSGGRVAEEAAAETELPEEVSEEVLPEAALLEASPLETEPDELEVTQTAIDIRAQLESEITGEYRFSELEAAETLDEDPIVELEPAREAVRLTLIETPIVVAPARERKIRRLESLLERVLTWKEGSHASQA